MLRLASFLTAVLAGCGHAEHRECRFAFIARPEGLARMVRPSEVATDLRFGRAQCGPEGSACEESCPSVDDMEALLGTGYACTANGPARVSACEPTEEWYARVIEHPGDPGVAPCPNAAPNRQIVLDVGDSTRLLLTFYDDPTCHCLQQDEICAPASHPRFYRLLSTRAYVTGEAGI